MLVQGKLYQKRPLGRLVLLILLFGGILYIWQFYQKVKTSDRDLIAPVVPEVVSVPGIQPLPLAPPTEEIDRINDSNLQKIITNSLAGTIGTYGIVIKNLKTGEHFELNPNHSFEAGSLYKLWVMAAIYEQEKNGSLQEDQILSEDISTLNQKFQIDPDLAEQTQGSVTYSVQDALYQMITISDNYTALLLTEKIGLSKLADILQKNDFRDSTVGINGELPTTTASDLAKFFDKLYLGQLIDKHYSQKMVDLLKMQKLNNKIPQYLPNNLLIAHKTGEIDTFTHDGGIVFAPKGDYIIVVLSDSDNPPVAEGRISDISQAIYGYFNGGR